MRKVFVLAIIIGSMISVAPASIASSNNEKVKNERTTNDATVDLRYVTEDEGSLILQIVFSQKSRKDAMLRISDNAGEQLFSERISQNSHVRYIKISPQEISDLELVAQTSSGIIRKKYSLKFTTVTSVKLQEVMVK